MRQSYAWLLWVALAVAALGALVIYAIVPAQEEARLKGERIAKLEADLAALRESITKEPAAGGSEMEPPERKVPMEQWTFPIAPEDYLQLTSPYGYRVSPVLDTELYHTGIDIAATWRAQVVAAAGGTVVEHWPPPGTPHPSGATFRGHDIMGGYVVIEHEDGWRSEYAHMDWTRVITGQDVQAGQVIGRVGNTGRSRGAHLHFEIRNPDGDPVNPLLYVAP